MNLRREQLLGYLLGALERAEVEQVERELAVNAQLRGELAEIRAALQRVGMNDPPEPVEPPAGLVERTCQFVADNENEPVLLPADHASDATAQAYTITDMLVAASVMLVLSALVFPSLVHSRFLARLTACQNNLRQIGFAMWQDSELRPDRTYSPLPWHDERAVAGMMAPILVERQLVGDPDVFVCPSSELVALVPGFPMPTVRQVNLASGQELSRLQKLVGGSFTYPIGFSQSGQVVQPRNMYRENYCLVGEAPIPGVGSGSLANHDGRGGNLFFEDGHIRWIPDSRYSLLPDNPYCNRQGQMAPGIDPDDAVLGPSDMQPPAPILPVSCDSP